MSKSIQPDRSFLEEAKQSKDPLMNLKKLKPQTLYPSGYETQTKASKDPTKIPDLSAKTSGFSGDSRIVVRLLQLGWFANLVFAAALLTLINGSLDFRNATFPGYLQLILAVMMYICAYVMKRTEELFIAKLLDFILLSVFLFSMVLCLAVLADLNLFSLYPETFLVYILLFGWSISIFRQLRKL